PTANRLRRRLELSRQLFRRAPRPNQIHHLIPERLRIRPLLCHRGLLPLPREYVSTKSGQLQPSGESVNSLGRRAASSPSTASGSSPSDFVTTGSNSTNHDRNNALAIASG